jgi:hypothetical protein
MAGPFIFISQSRIKEGRLDDFKRGLREMAEFVEANEPRGHRLRGLFQRRQYGGNRRPDPPRRGLHGVPHADRLGEDHGVRPVAGYPKRGGLRGAERRRVGHDEADRGPIRIGDVCAHKDQACGRVRSHRLILPVSGGRGMASLSAAVVPDPSHQRSGGSRSSIRPRFVRTPGDEWYAACPSVRRRA